MNTELKADFARRDAILQKVRDLLIDALKVQSRPEELDPDTPLFGTGLGLDSVDAVELVVCFETAFGIRLTENESRLTALRTINTLVDIAIAHEESLRHAQP